MTELDILLKIGETLQSNEINIEISILTSANLLDNNLQFTRNGRVIFPHSGDSNIIKNFISVLDDGEFAKIENSTKYLSEALIHCFGVKYRYEMFKMLLSERNKNECLNLMSKKSYEHFRSTITTYL